MHSSIFKLIDGRVAIKRESGTFDVRRVLVVVVLARSSSMRNRAAARRERDTNRENPPVKPIRMGRILIKTS